ncbi:MAG: D-glycerate dehydrogenase [Candidatus Thermoplasmatota archaeon]|nr:D-glycerate dehydrogenase [Candidatus Thermoplasmatota archaeon]MDP7266166.1 D-glycerate dehydrogenase [Candidatus Thermoplasmatota archaeon]
MRERIFFTRRIPSKGIEILKKDYELHIREDESIPTKEEIIDGIVGCEGLVCLLTDPIDRDVLSSPDLKFVSTYAAGYNNIDVTFASSRKIPVTNAPGALTETTADIAFALLLSAGRRVVEGDRFLREGSFHGWSPMLLLGQDIHGKTLGIVGAGRIGGALARRAVGFRMNILYYNRKPDPVLERETGAVYTPFDQLLCNSDFVSLHTPLTRETEHIISAREFGLMKKKAVFINTSRGPCVNENDLVKALESGDIWAAGLDVFEREPLVDERLLCMDNVVLLPHLGSASFDTRTGMAVTACTNMAMMLAGKRPPNIINPEVYSDIRI